MRNILFTCFFFFILLNFACQKSIQKANNQGQLNTVTQNIEGDSNSVSLSDAAQIAVGYLHGRSPRTTFTVRKAETITDKAGTPYFHVIHCNDGFVILSASKLYRAVLAYGYKGDFSMTDMPIGIRRWLNTHAYYMKYIRDLNSGRPSLDTIAAKKRQVYSGLLSKYAPTPIESPTNALAVNGIASPDVLPPPAPTISLDYYFYDTATVGPLLQTEWSQGCNFNEYVPTNSGGPCGYDYAGCIPVAMAQIIYYWHPNNNYTWSKMTQNDQDGDTAEARLIDDIGETHIGSGGTGPTLVSYGPTVTTGNDENAPYVFGQFGLNSTRSEDIDDQILSGGKNGIQYEYLLVNQLLYNQLPCMIGASPGENDILGVYYPTGIGHEWVCSGAQNIYEYGEYTETLYKSPSLGGGILSQMSYPVFIDSSTYLYMNWGETAGISNSWYNCSLPEGYSTDYDNNVNYQFFQTVLYNIYP